jgi:poly(3-hydroxybutyrate) depolymerase
VNWVAANAPWAYGAYLAWAQAVQAAVNATVNAVLGAVANWINGVYAVAVAAWNNWFNTVAAVGNAEIAHVEAVKNAGIAAATAAVNADVARSQAAIQLAQRFGPFNGIGGSPFLSADLVDENSAGADFFIVMQVGNLIRSFELYVPITAVARISSGTPSRLVIDMHGVRADHTAQDTDGMKGAVAALGWIIAYPDAYAGAGNAWNAGTCCAPATIENVDDVGFARAMIRYLPGIDHNHAYAMGYSNGGMEAQRLGSELSEIAAVVTVVGPNPWSSLPNKNYPNGATFYGGEGKPVLQFYGTADWCVGFYGGGACSNNPNSPVNYTLATFPSAKDNAELWSARNGCTDPTALSVQNLGSMQYVTNSTCPADKPVEAYWIPGGNHLLYGFEPFLIAQFLARH